MMDRRLSGITVSLLICISLLLFPGPVLAMPFNAAVNYPAGNEPIFMVAGDFNRDGTPDLVVANYYDNTVSILMGKGDGTFDAPVSYAVGSSPSYLAAGDFDNDGKLDLAAANSNDGDISILRGKGDGTFYVAVDYNVGPISYSVAAGDFNKDGFLDLAVGNIYDGKIYIMRGQGNCAFVTTGSYNTGANPFSVGVGDLNGDGKLDLATANEGSASVSVLLGNGDLTFNTAVDYDAGSNPYSVAVGDFNRDGKLDLAVANYLSNNVSVLLGKGDGTFNAAVNYAVGSYPASVAVGDFNCDNKPDLAVANAAYYGSVSILIGKGDGTFDAAVNYNTKLNTASVAVGDFNGDGSTDLALANRSSNNVSIFLDSVPCSHASPNVAAATVNTSLGNVGFTTSAGSISGLANTAPADMRCSVPSGYNFPYGMFSFNITSLTAGQTVKVTIRFPNPLPLGTKYYKCINGNMVDCSSLVTRIDTNTLQLALTDGGLGDADGVANGTIIDPGGPAFPFSAMPQSSSSQMPAPSAQKPVSLSNITIKSASLSAAKVIPGTPVTVTASVANTGTGNGTSVIKVYVNGAEEAQQGVTVNSGSATQVSFNVSRSEPGTYTVYVGGTNAGSFTVDQFADPNIILYISGALLVFAFVVGLMFILRKRQPGH